MANAWDKFDKVIDTEGLQKDVAEASQNSSSFREVPHGKYEVSITKLELVESKKGDPMVSCWMKVVSGEYKGSLIFMNQVITKGFQIHIANEFLRRLDSGFDVGFTTYSQYGQLLMDIHEAVDEQLEYALEYGEKKGFNTFEIVEVFDAE